MEGRDFNSGKVKHRRTPHVLSAACAVFVLVGLGQTSVDSMSIRSAGFSTGTQTEAAQQAQDSEERRAYRRIEEALNSGDVRTLYYGFADQVEISIMGERSMYSRSQALYVMRDFFRLHPPERFAFDDASRTPGGQFAVGHYETRGEEHTLRIFVRMRIRDDRWELKELRIEPRQSR